MNFHCYVEMIGMGKDQLEESLISKMLNDTFIEVSINDIEPVSNAMLDDYFQQRLTEGSAENVPPVHSQRYQLMSVMDDDHKLLFKYLNSQDVIFCSGVYCRTGGFYRLYINESTIIDIPDGWSFLSGSLGSFAVQVGLNGDPDHFIDIIKNLVPTASDVVVMGVKQKELVMIITNELQYSILNVLKSYFANGDSIIKKLTRHKKAA